jgi:carboxyl-terminal processing protease
MKYVDTHRSELQKKYRTISKFKSSFEVSESELSSLLSSAEEEKIEFNEEQYLKSKPLITLQLKALIARDLFDMSEYYQIVNDQNESLLEALRIINDPISYRKILGDETLAEYP